MSDEKKKDDFDINMEKAIKLEKLKADTDIKKAEVENYMYTAKLEAIEQNERDLELAKNANYGALSAEEILNTVKSNDDYMAAAQNPISFICSSFNNVVPFFRKNLILVAGKSGHGKSAAVANMAYHALTAKDPVTGKILRTLVITNEERREDFLNRVTSLVKGWHYTNHSKFTEKQRKEFSRMIPVLSSSGRLTVIDDCHGGAHGVTTSVEGLESIFNNLLEKKEYYDVVIIDYYQNFITSKKNPSMTQYQVQEKVTRLLDNFKNAYPAPIVIMSQLKPENDKDTPFQLRIMGSKSIMVPATFAMEMIIDIKNSCTRWIVHKSRYADSMGKDFKTGYDNGKFVEYSTTFIAKVERRFMDRQANIINSKIDEKSPGVPSVPKEDDKKEIK